MAKKKSKGNSVDQYKGPTRATFYPDPTPPVAPPATPPTLKPNPFPSTPPTMAGLLGQAAPSGGGISGPLFSRLIGIARPPLDPTADQANKAAYMASGESNAPAAPPAVQPGGLTDQLQAALDAMAPHINQADYTAPYDEAIKRANDAYAASTPVINDIYSQLASKLGDQRTAAHSDIASALAAMQGQQAGTQNQLAGLDSQVLADIARQGGSIQQGAPTAAAQAMAQAGQAGLVSQGANQQNFLQNIGQARDASLVDRTSSADAAKAAAMSTAHNTLNSVLDQLGIGKASAQRSFAADSAAAARQQAQARLSILQSQAAQAKSDHTDFTKAFQQASKQAQEPAGDAWLRSNLPAIQQQFPKSAQAFTDIIAATKAKGAQGLAEATSKLHDFVNSGGQKTGEADYSKYGFVPDQGTYQVMSDWLQNYFNDTPTVNEDRFAQALQMLGVDPSAG